MTLNRELTPHQVRELAVAALVSPMTIRRWLRGGSIRTISEERIKRGLKELGIEVDAA